MNPKTFLPAVLLICSAFNNAATAQNSVEEAMSRKHPDCEDVYKNAIEVIPRLYREHSFDSLRKAIDIWEMICGTVPEIKYTKILLSIERSSFDFSMPEGLIESLDRYSSNYKNYQRYHASTPSSDYYKVIAAWAKLLLQQKKLSVNEKFVCDVFAGNINDPRLELRQQKEEYAELYNLMIKDLADQKKSGSTEYTLISGVWIPTQNAAVLGIHPSLGLQIGGRFDRHQIDLTIQFRFLNTGETYYVKRSGNLYNVDHFFGGYIGLDYNYYFINKTRYDLGLLGGLGFDGFDIFSGDNSENDYLKPLSINSFNVNTGLRFNYIFSPSFYLGLQSRYNFVNYGTGGGSNLNGDAVSFDLIFGFTSRPSNVYRHSY